MIVAVAIPGPFFQTFDYTLTPSAENAQPFVGRRVQVTFGKRTVVGVITSEDVPASDLKLKPVNQVLDNAPLYQPIMMRFITQVSRYYHHPIGLCFQCALLPALHAGKPFQTKQKRCYQLTTSGLSALDVLTRSPKQYQAIHLLKMAAAPMSQDDFNAYDVKPQILSTLMQKGFVEMISAAPAQRLEITEAHQTPTPEQAAILKALTNQLTGFSVHLLMGVTGSGKTEVYLQAIEAVIQAGRQVLILVPEIGLTPQTFTRFQKRFSTPVSLIHSGLTASEKMAVWHGVYTGQVQIVIGTRSALFLPFQQLGMMIVDEEHDLSFKQQTQLPYHGRDMAILRAKLESIPILLGSATPSLESLHHAYQGRYQLHLLSQRTNATKPLETHLIDMCGQQHRGGISVMMLDKIRAHLAQGNQVLLFLNRRGFAPVYMCHACGWCASCHRCDASYTLHAGKQRLVCHHCGSQAYLPKQCETCGEQENLVSVGVGTEQVADTLSDLFPDETVLRFDRDTVQTPSDLYRYLEMIDRCEARLIVGTQMLAKGHHFDRITMVGVIDCDNSLFSSDFRACERLAQLLTQVSGRAGRGELSGEVYIQTHQVGHPLLNTLLRDGFDVFSRQLLAEREQIGMPPYSYIAMIRAEAPHFNVARDFLEDVRERLSGYRGDAACQFLGPIPALMQRKAGVHRVQLLCQSTDRRALHHCLAQWIQRDSPQSSKRVRWQLDVDPQELL